MSIEWRRFSTRIGRSTLKLSVLASMLAAATALGAPATLKGEATLSERMGLQPDAAFEATLEDISVVGGEPIVLGRTRVDSPGAPPIRFKINYDDASIKPDGKYALRARITHRQRLLFSTENQRPVVLGPQAAQADIVLHRVVGAAPVPPPPSVLAPLPASYMGVFPCSDCLEIKYHLNLLPEGRYELRMIYVGKPRDKVDTRGAWSERSKERVIEIKDVQGASEQIEIVDAGTLRKLDISGQPLPAGFSYDLKRQANFAPL